MLYFLTHFLRLPALVFYLLMLMVGGANAQISVGVQFCQNSPSECGLFSQNDVDNAKQAGKDECRNDPRACGLLSEVAFINIREQTRSECQRNPESCGIQIVIQPDRSGIEQGIDQCRNNPASCGITVTQNDDGSTEAGINQCRNNPASCGIIMELDRSGIERGIDQCRNNPASCGLFSPNLGRERTNLPSCEKDKVVTAIESGGSEFRMSIPSSLVSGLETPSTCYHLSLALTPLSGSVYPVSVNPVSQRDLTFTRTTGTGTRSNPR